MKLLKSVRYKPTQPTMSCYGHAHSGVTEQEINPVCKWLFDNLEAKGYFGKSHFFMYNSENRDRTLEQLVKAMLEQGREPIFLYRCGEKVQAPPSGYYWRMAEHPSKRVYQLEVIANAC